MIVHGVDIEEGEIALFCRRYGVERLGLFGSILGNDFRADSDVDVLVEFPRGQTPSLLTLGAMQMELSELLGRRVDLRTPGDLSRYFRDEVVRSARNLYVA